MLLGSPRERALRTATLVAQALRFRLRSRPSQPKALKRAIQIHEPLSGGFDAQGSARGAGDRSGPSRSGTDGGANWWLRSSATSPTSPRWWAELTGARIDLKKGGLAVVRLDGPSGELVALLRPNELALIAEGGRRSSGRAGRPTGRRRATSGRAGPPAQRRRSTSEVSGLGAGRPAPRDRVPDVADRRSASDHRDHRPGRLVSRGAPAGEGLRGPRHGAPVLDGAFDRIEHLRDRITLHQGDLLDQRSLVDALRAARPDGDLQPRGDVVRRRLVDPADADGGVHGRGSDADARGDARSLPGGALLPGLLERDVRQGARGAADRADALLPALPVRRGEGLRPLHHRQLPRVLRPARDAAGSCSTTSPRAVGWSS